MTRQEAFEVIYAKQREVPAESLVQYRHKSKDGYNLPQIASHYRTYCEVLDSIVVDLTMLNVQHASFNNVDCYGVVDVHKRINAAGVKVKS